MSNQPIPVNQATIMVQNYLTYMTGLGVDISRQTQSVGYNAQDLRQWMDSVIQFCDEFRFCFGVYPAGDPNAGRMTVAVWPYKNGQPATNGGGKGAEIEPFNAGGLIP